MVFSRRLLAAAAALTVSIGVAAYAVGASAQPRQGERIVGYSVYAHSHYVLVERADGTMRTCIMNRQTALNRSPRWECTDAPALP